MADKFTDAEKLKALETCVYGTSVCQKCHYNYSDDCQRTMMIDILDIITRKNEMIDALIAGQETLQKAIAERDAEIKLLKKDRYICKNGELSLLPRTDLGEIKFEAIKEFAFDLTEEIKGIYRFHDYEDKDDIIGHVLDKIDNLVKERTKEG